MPAAFVQSAFAAGGLSDATLTVALTPTTGNLLAVYVGNLQGNVVVTVDDGTNTYTAVDDLTVIGFLQGSTFYAKNITGGALTITAHFPGDAAFRSLMVHEISGCDTTAPLDQHAIAHALDSGSVTTTVNGEYIFGGAYRDAVGTHYTAGAGYTLRIDDISVVDSATEDQIQSSAGSISASFGGAGADTLTTIMTFKPVAVVASTLFAQSVF